MMTFTSKISFLLLLLLSATTLHSTNHSRLVRCNEKDRGILVSFKQGIIDRFDDLSTWSTETDCCAWTGVHCHNVTGRVTKLELLRFSLEGEMNLSLLLQLEFLNYLDLSWNEFDVISIDHNVTLASNLHYLDLSSWNNDVLHMDNLQWLSPLSSLKYLNLSGIDLHKETNWLQFQLVATMLPSLSELRLTDCNLNDISPSLEYVNFTSLLTLDLFNNNFNSELPYWLFNLSGHISYLDLSWSHIHGEMPCSLLNLPNLRYLDLSDNQLSGSIPDWIGQQQHLQHLDLSSNMFCDWIGQQQHLQHLDLSSNMFCGSNIPPILGNLSSLVTLKIGYNDFSGAIYNTTFSKRSKLDELDLTNSTFAFYLDPEWIPPFQLSSLSLGNTNQGPNFPSWIYTQKSLKHLDLSSSGISLANGNKFWSFVEGIDISLGLSNNSLKGDISNVTLNASFIYLDHNNFTGRLPHISPMARDVDLSHNSFSGSIPRYWENMEYLKYIDLWSNKLSGEVLEYLSNWRFLEVMVLGKNEFSGTIPVNLPQDLEVIILRDNQFEGNIPPQLFNLSNLSHLDLAQNKLSGSLPQYVYNMTQMVWNNMTTGFSFFIIDLFIKGQHYENPINIHRRTFDLSVNNLSGEIPSELFQLFQVQTLNLSYNHFMGTIPKTIGDMKYLESLDLSNNKLSGEIPQSMTILTFLGYLNLSCNNFIGKIPIGTQLQSFDGSSYSGNPELCGAPLKNCTTEGEEEDLENRKHPEDGIDPLRESLYLGMGVGFAVGFWGICGSLLLIRKWRHTYYHFLDRVADHLYVTWMVNFNNFGKTQAPSS
ncbi:Leucine-rich repeat [Sesbania bispinosa]|nr:Leucine-rich repeat [Sesbania bispinosa]